MSKNLILDYVADSPHNTNRAILSQVVDQYVDEVVKAMGPTGTSTNADWEQNDSTAKDYVKNRTHYKETKTYLIADNFETTYSERYYEEGDETVRSLEPNNFPYNLLIENMEPTSLKVFVNGEPIKVVNYHKFGSIEQWLLENNLIIDYHSYIDGDSSEPQISWDVRPINGFEAVDGQKFNLTVTIDDVIYVPIDEKYMPKSILEWQQPVDWNCNDVNDPTYIKNKTHYISKESGKVLYDGYGDDFVFQQSNQERYAVSELFAPGESYYMVVMEPGREDKEIVISNDTMTYEYEINGESEYWYQSLEGPDGYSYKIKVTLTKDYGDGEVSDDRYVRDWSFIDIAPDYIKLCEAKKDIYNPLDDRFIPGTIKRVNEYDYSYTPETPNKIFEERIEGFYSWDYRIDVSETYNIMINNIMYSGQKFEERSYNEYGWSTKLEIPQENFKISVRYSEGEYYNYIYNNNDFEQFVEIWQIIPESIVQLNEMFIPDTIARAPKATLNYVADAPTAEQFNALLDILKEAGILAT